MTPTPRFEMLVGLWIDDDARYDQYRAGMIPILESLGGYFRYDFRVSETLKAPEGEKFNRVFVLSFPDEHANKLFFQHDAYRAVRDKFFDTSVKSATIIASLVTP
jgi:uncharacterized protein (DUF1330 family)